MNIREAVLEEHSKAQALKIRDYIGTSQKRFDELMECFFDENVHLSQRSAYSMMMTVDQHPYLIKPYLEKVILNLKNPVHVAVKRNTLRFLENENIEIPENILGTLVDMCFQFLDSVKEPVAIRVFSMGVLFRVAKKEPDLFHELKVIIEDHLPTGSSGFKSRGRKYLKYMNKVMKDL